MSIVLCALMALTPVSITRTEVSLRGNEYWSRHYILAPGDTLRVRAQLKQQLGSMCGCLGFAGDLVYGRARGIKKLAIAEWRGEDVTSAMRQEQCEIAYASSGGGAYTVVLSNASRHRQAIYDLEVERTPGSRKYADFDATFKTDTTYDTTWTKETRQRLVRTDVIQETTWAKIKVPAGSDTTERTVMNETKHVSALSSEFVTFTIPSGTDVWAYWVGVAEAYSAMKQVFGASMQIAGTMVSPLTAFALNAVSSLATNPTTNADIDYTLQVAQYGQWATVVAGGRTKEGFRRMTSGAGSQHSFVLDNSYSLLTPKNVHIEVTAVIIEERFTEEMVPDVRTRKKPVYEDYEVDVPRVDMEVHPVLPWKR